MFGSDPVRARTCSDGGPPRETVSDPLGASTSVPSSSPSSPSFWPVRVAASSDNLKGQVCRM